jgi:predicted transcriptional regulator of viral defense system
MLRNLCPNVFRQRFCNTHAVSAMPVSSHVDRLLRHVQRHGVVCTRDLETLGVSRVALQRAVDRGQVVRRARGVYVKPDHATTRHTDVADVAARSPKAIVCLLSALEYHSLTTQVPHAVWIMIQKSAHRPTITSPVIRVVRASGSALTAGVEKHTIEGVLVQMTNPAKTVADCFRYRDTVGTDVAVEALRDCLRARRATPADIFEMAKVDRVARVMRPYLEALT